MNLIGIKLTPPMELAFRIDEDMEYHVLGVMAAVGCKMPLSIIQSSLLKNNLQAKNIANLIVLKG